MAVKRALTNLLGNAKRYAERAEISVAVSPKAVRFTVEEEGEGKSSIQLRKRVLHGVLRHHALIEKRLNEKGNRLGICVCFGFIPLSSQIFAE